MKKILLLSAILLITTGAGCKTEPNQTANKIADLAEPLSCFEICHTRLDEICPEWDLDLLEYTEDNCISDCEKFWTDADRSCFTDATKCEQISLADEPYCREDPEPAVEYEPVPDEVAACEAVCVKYKTCAGYADDATAADKDSAYTTCYSECQSWSEQTISCMQNVSINNAADCSRLSACGLQQYSGIINQ